MQDVTARRQDSIRLELLVGILSLAADETPPDEIVAHAAQSLAGLFGDVDVSYVGATDEGGFGSATRPTRAGRSSGTRSSGQPTTSSGSNGGRSSSRTSPRRPGSIRCGPADRARRRLIVDVPLFRHGELRARSGSTARALAWGTNTKCPPGGTSRVSSRSSSRARGRASCGTRRARPTQPRRDPPGGQPLRRALPRPAKPRRRDRRADARPRRGDGGHERVRLRERQSDGPSTHTNRSRAGHRARASRRSTTHGSRISTPPPTSHAGPRCSVAEGL